MALGSSSPEILLSIIEICGNKFKAGELGPGTIVGSAAYNLLMISALCVLAIKNGDVRRIKNYKVFVVTALWSIFAYMWLYLVLVVFSPNEVSLWEAILTLIFFPLVVLNSYAAEKNFWMTKCFPQSENVEMNINDMC
jgi:solute carrier family 8 (sodium/calcium exchanger)